MKKYHSRRNDSFIWNDAKDKYGAKKYGKVRLLLFQDNHVVTMGGK